jgi:small ligand-binding sensory domain FIST
MTGAAPGRADFAASLSQHPLPTHAVGEVIGHALEQVGEAPDLAVLFVTAAHAGAMEDIARAVREVLRPGCQLAASAVSVLAGAQEVEEQPAMALWAARLGERVTPVRLTAAPSPDGMQISGMPALEPGDDRVLVLLADPFTFPVDQLLEQLTEEAPTLRVAGGMASAARGPGGNRLVLDGAVTADGAVGALLPAGASVTTVVSQGCRPIGDPMTVTRSEGQVVYELAGRPALERLVELLGSLSEEERALAQQGIHLGHVIDEHKAEFTRGDFLIRNVLGGDRDAGAIAVGDDVQLGATVQFQVRDASSADEDLRELLAGEHAASALVFTCNGRGMRLFGQPDHDAEVIDAHVEGGATAGMFCAGELGPVGGQSFLHGFTASVLLFNGRKQIQ